MVDKERIPGASLTDKTLPASDTPHIEGKWCADLHCSKCYGADTWQQSYINELHRSLSAALAEIDRLKNGRAIGEANCILGSGECERLTKAESRADAVEAVLRDVQGYLLEHDHEFPDENPTCAGCKLQERIAALRPAGEGKV